MPDYKTGGFPFKQLPAAGDMTPESIINKQIQTGRQEIQQRFTLAWDEINRSARFIGQRKALNMRQQLHAKAKQEMLQFNQQAKQQLIQLRNVDRLAQQGAITNPEEIKARITFGADVARSMYPKEPSIPEQFGKLDVYSHRISQELERFQIVGDKVPSKFLSRLKGISPLATAVSALRGPPKGRKGELQIWDPTIPTKIKDKTTGKMIDAMGEFRIAESGEIGIYQAWLQEERDIDKRKLELLGHPSIQRRVIQPGTKGGTFSDKIAESVVPQRAPTMAKPKMIRQRNRRTGKERISYDGGKTWQMSGKQ